MHRSRRNLERLLCAALTAAFLLSLTFTAALADSGPPWLDTTLDDLSYTEQQGWVALDSDVTVFSNTDDWSEGYIDLAISSATADDQFRLVSGGLLTVSGNAVYYNGDRVGTIDNTYDGSNGRLRINFSSSAPLLNADFETGDLTGWTVNNANNQMQGQSWAEGPLVPPPDSDPAFDDGLAGNSRSATVNTAAAHEGTYGLQLSISGQVTDGYGTDHAPSVISSAFSATAGDTLSMQWFAAQTSDYYDVFGFVFDDADDDSAWDTGEAFQRLFHDTGAQTVGWETLNTALTIGSSNLRFLFINGTYDQTGGRAIGSYLYIDGIELQIASATVVDDVIVADIIEHIEYQNTSDDPPATEDYRIDFEESDNSTGFNTAQIHFTGTNDDPTDIDLSNDTVDEHRPSGTVVGTFSANDPDSGDTHTFSLVPGAGSSGNAFFSIVGNTLQTAAVFDYETQTSYTIRVQADDGNGGTYEEVFTIDVLDLEDVPPQVVSILTADPNPTSASSVDFTVTFDENVTGVGVSDFVLMTSGVSGTSVTGVSGSGTDYTVTVNTGTGSGTIRLDLTAGATILDLANNAFVGPYTDGETYTIDRTNSAVTSILRHVPLTSPTNATSVTFRVTFGEDVQFVDTTDFGLSLSGTVTGTVNAVAVQSASVYDVTITGVGGNGTLGLTFQATNNIEDLVGNPLGPTPTIGTAETYTIDTSAISVITAGVVGYPGAVTISDGGHYTTHFTSIEVTYDSDANNPGGSSDPEDVTNPLNYMLIEDGPNGVPGMTACINLDTDDVFIATGPVTYDNNGGAGPYVATITVNGGTPLPSGTYRLFICSAGATIVDLAGNPLNGGADEIRDFTIFNPSGLPATGFSPGQTTILPEQPANLAYTGSGLQLVIPRLSLQMDIVGVPEVKGEWDISWLGSQAGWLQGTAFPGWDGNSVLTGHVYGYNGKPGPFASLDRLAYGDRIEIAAWNQVYIYEVREVTQVPAQAVSTVLKHEEKPWLTLLTCRGYDSSDGSYRDRLFVRAVQIRIDELR